MTHGHRPLSPAKSQGSHADGGRGGRPRCGHGTCGVWDVEGSLRRMGGPRKGPRSRVGTTTSYSSRACQRNRERTQSWRRCLVQLRHRNPSVPRSHRPHALPRHLTPAGLSPESILGKRVPWPRGAGTVLTGDPELLASRASRGTHTGPASPALMDTVLTAAPGTHLPSSCHRDSASSWPGPPFPWAPQDSQHSPLAPGLHAPWLVNVCALSWAAGGRGPPRCSTRTNSSPESRD